MKAAVVQSFDAPPRYVSFADPIAEEGEVLVNISAAGLHQIVRSLASGRHYGSSGSLPFIPGVDGVGKLEDGTRVYFGAAKPPYGSFAERTATNRSFCLPIPAALDDATAAAIANPAMSSWAALNIRAGFRSGESVLILGATGTSGKLAVQIAKRLGARNVIAVGRNQQVLEELRGLGADFIIPLDLEPSALVSEFRRVCAQAGVDIVLDYLWGRPAESVLEALSQKGLQRSTPRVRFVQVGSMAGDTITLPAATLRSTGIELIGSGFGSAKIEQIFQSVAEFFQEAARKPFQIEIQEVPLKDIESFWNKGSFHARVVFRP